MDAEINMEISSFICKIADTWKLVQFHIPSASVEI